MINIKLEVNGTEFDDFTRIRVHRTMSDYNTSSNFHAILPNAFGRHATDFEVGDEVQIFADQDAAPTTLIFTGIIEQIRFFGRESRQRVELSGKDYSARLQDQTVSPVVFTDSEVSTIITNIIDENEVSDDITTTNVDVTSTTLSRIAFNQDTIFDAFTSLARSAGFYFFVDENKDLNFKLQRNVSDNITFDNTNTLVMLHDKTREGMANQVAVYGDRYLAGFREVNFLNGSPWGGAVGSVFTLLDKPHNTLIEHLGVTQKGGVFELVTQPISGTNYLVSFHDKQLIFTSGTTLGNSIPLSGGSIVSIYDREIPIVKIGQNDESVKAFGPKAKIINDKSIRDPNTARDRLIKELEDTDPFRRIEIQPKGWFTLTPGNTVDVVLSDLNVNLDEIGILDITYNFTPESIRDESVLTVRVDKKVRDITDEVTDLRRRLSAIESADRQDTDIITRLLQSTGSMLIVGSKWLVQTRTLGSSFILSKGPHGVTGPIFGGILGSIIGSGINFLGDSRTSLSINTSGGYNY